MKYFLSALFLIALTPLLLAQPLEGSSKIEKVLLAADSALTTNNWYVALENYELAYEQDEELPLRPVIALMNLRLRDIKSAVRGYGLHFRRVDPADTTNNVHRYHYARALKMDGEYDEARTYFENFLQHNDDDKLAQFTRIELEGIKQFKDAATETNEVALESLDRKINSSFSEYSPILSADGKTLYYSTWDASNAVEQSDANDEAGFSRIFRATQDDKGKWDKPVALGKEVNRPGVHSANPALSADGRRLYYNRIAMESNRVAEAKIYMSDVEDEGWKSGNPVSGINGEDYLALQPAAGELFGREVLFFVSDMDGGFGGKDIYYANYEGEGRFGNPVNLGEKVNTIGDDVTPFYFDGTLYFATDGLPTMGGRDLFYTSWDGSKWSTPENLGVGFNSTVDDQSLSVYGDGLVGFMTSNREGGRSIKSKTCCDDIYGYQVASLYANLVVGLFNEAKEPLTTGTIGLQPLLNARPQGLGQQKSRDDGNRFDFGLELETNYSVVATHPGYYPDTVEVNTLGLTESKELQHVFFLRPIPAPPAETPPVEIEVTIGDAITLENILYDFNDDKILPAAEPDLRFIQQMMEKYPEMVIELGSHTDSRGKADFNLNLSKRRAASARKWLIVNGGISGPRIKTEGYGKAVPQTATARLADRVDFLKEGDILTDDFINALPDEATSERAHQLNRRTEFKILEGPDKIIIDGKVIERNLAVPNRGREPRASQPSPAPFDRLSASPTAAPQKKATTSTQPDPPVITRFSSLFGQKDVKGLPILQFDKRELPLGSVKKGGTRSFDYTFTNKGTVPAQIMLIQACSCTTYEHDNSKIYAPGQSGKIKVTFDSSEKDEDETITIDIYLEQKDKRGIPILEMVEYDFKLLK
jgi:peptidoglycan-associated lipoprotein